jgi:hypothetical protein
VLTKSTWKERSQDEVEKKKAERNKLLNEIGLKPEDAVYF